MFDFLLGNDLLSAILAFVIVLIPAVIIHEMGHFLAARAVGISVLEFGVGFPPRIARLFMWRETEFTLNAIPLGGFVRPFGEDMVQPSEEGQGEGKAASTEGQVQDDDAKLPETAAYMRYEETGDSQTQDPITADKRQLAERGVTNPVSVYDVKPLPRIFFMAAGALANVLFAIVIFVLIGFIGVPEEVGARIGIAEFDEGSPMAETGLQPNDWITAVNGEYVNGVVDFVDRLEANQGEVVELTLRRPDESEDFSTVMLDLRVSDAVLDMWQNVGAYVRVIEVADGSPADEAGLQSGDLIYAMDGDSIRNETVPTQALQEKTQAATGSEISVSVLREGEDVTVNLVPRVDPPPGEGSMGIVIESAFTTPDQSVVFRLGPEFNYIPQPADEAVAYSLQETSNVFEQILALPSRLIQGATEPGEARVISVVGVSQLGGAILQESIEASSVSVFLRYIALISIALGFTNMLPIPALDGGRIIFAVIELVRGKPVAPEREGYVHMIGLIFLLSLGVLLIINDLANPVSDLIR